MKVEEIISIIDDAFADHIAVFTAETVLGTEVWIEGKEEFIREIREKLEKQTAQSSNG